MNLRRGRHSLGGAEQLASPRLRIVVLAGAIAWAAIVIGFSALLLAAYLSHHR